MMKVSKTILSHLIIWLCVPIVVSFFVWIFVRSVFSIENLSIDFLELSLDKENILNNFIIVSIGAFSFYSMYYAIAPYFLYKERVLKIVIGILILILQPVLVILVLGFFFESVDGNSLFIAYPILILFSVVGALFRFWKYGRTKNLENVQLAQKTLKTQLTLLKAQINPHFLFNTINNIDVLIESNPKVASNYLKQLSDLLRFVLYRTSKEDTILLVDEIEYLKKYISLQKIRSVNPNFVEFTVTGNPSSITIAPMIFIVFVENAFKYVADKKKDGAIQFYINISSDALLFKSRNTIKKGASVNHETDNGLGLTTVKQRLDLIYKDRYKLDILSNDDHYETTLLIELK